MKKNKIEGEEEDESSGMILADYDYGRNINEIEEDDDENDDIFDDDENYNNYKTVNNNSENENENEAKFKKERSEIIAETIAWNYPTTMVLQGCLLAYSILVLISEIISKDPYPLTYFLTVILIFEIAYISYIYHRKWQHRLFHWKISIACDIYLLSFSIFLLIIFFLETNDFTDEVAFGHSAAFEDDVAWRVSIGIYIILTLITLIYQHEWRYLSRPPRQINNASSLSRETQIKGESLSFSDGDDYDKRYDGYYHAGLFSKATYSFFAPVIQLGSQRPLNASDLVQLPKYLSVIPNYNRLLKYIHIDEDTFRSQHSLTSQHYQPPVSSSSSQRRQSTLLLFFKSFRGPILEGVFWRLLRTVGFLAPAVIFMPLLLDFVKDREDGKKVNNWDGIWFAAGISLNSFFLAVANHTGMNQGLNTGLRVRGAYLGILMDKILACKSAAIPTGTLNIIVASDSMRLIEATTFVHNLYGTVIELALISYFLATNLSWYAALPGLFINIFFFLFQSRMGPLLSRTRRAALAASDARVRKMVETINSMKITKLYAWEDSLISVVNSKRAIEIQAFWNVCVIKIWNATLSLGVPLLGTTVSIATYVYLVKKTDLEGDSHVIDPVVVFTSLALFNLFRLPMSMFPNSLRMFMDGMVAIKRLDEFLKISNIETRKPPSDANILVDINSEAEFFYETHSMDAVANAAGLLGAPPASTPSAPSAPPTTVGVVEKKDSKKEKEKKSNGDSNFFLLSKCPLLIKRGELIVVVGSVGSGKSSLFYALLGEMCLKKGKCLVSSNICYSPQQASIFNGTVKENILFGQTYNESLYNEVIAATALNVDLQQFASGDDTLVGERGVQLSGGQKYRLQLARTLYANGDLYLLDDPISAVDSKTADILFSEMIFKFLIIKRQKAVILTTHRINDQYKSHELIKEYVLMKNGNISARGTFDHLMSSNTEFASLIGGSLMSYSTTSSIHAVTNGSSSSSSTTPPTGSTTETEKKTKMTTESTSLLSSSSDKKDDQHDGKQSKIEKEHRDTGDVNSKVYSAYFLSMGGELFVAGWMSILIGSQACKLGNDFLLSNYVDEIGVDWSTDAFIGFYISLTIIFMMMMSLGLYLFYKGTLRAAQVIHEKCFKAVMFTHLSFFETNPLGRITNRFSGDMDALDEGLPSMLEITLTFGLSVIGSFVVVIAVFPWYLLIFFPTCYICWRYQSLFRLSSRELKRLESISRSPVFSIVGSLVGGSSQALNVVRTLHQKNKFRNLFFEYLTSSHSATWTMWMFGRFMGFRLDMLAAITITAASFFCVFTESIDTGTAGLVLSYAFMISGQLQFAVRQTVDAESKFTSVERLMEYINILKPEETDDETAKKELKYRDWKPTKGTVVFDKVMMRYSEKLPYVLKNCSVTFNGGSSFGIVGRTGAGKSSLSVALFRIVELAGGKITIDNVNIADLPIRVLRRNLAIIPQDPVLFEGNVRSNLDPFSEYDDKSIWLALEKVSLRSFFENDGDNNKGPSGLLYKISENGENLSVGQKQLICIARVLLKKPKILLLDEASSSVDSVTDNLIQKTIQESFVNNGCTVLVIAHRPSSVLNCDSIVVVDAGEIVEVGNPQVLLNDSSSKFFQLVGSHD